MVCSSVIARKRPIKLPRISLGLWHNFGDNASYENMKELCFTAFDNGITHFDNIDSANPRTWYIFPSSISMILSA